MLHARKDYDRIQDPSGVIPECEPVFLLRGKDKNAPTIVRMWAVLAEESGASRHIVLAARQQADRMDYWQTMHGRKVPDMPASAVLD